MGHSFSYVLCISHSVLLAHDCPQITIPYRQTVAVFYFCPCLAEMISDLNLLSSHLLKQVFLKRKTLCKGNAKDYLQAMK